jgi:uncharacterized protein YndB with AHSA1/START domain
MPDIFHSFVINAPLEKVFGGISTPQGLDAWWSKSSTGKPGPGETYTLDFGPGYNWSAVVSKYMDHKEFELTMTEADADWMGTRVGFLVNVKSGITEVHFHHLGWPENNEHYRISSYCWAMYLRTLKRYLEYGEQVPYEDRLSV